MVPDGKSQRRRRCPHKPLPSCHTLPLRRGATVPPCDRRRRGSPEVVRAIVFEPGKRLWADSERHAAQQDRPRCRRAAAGDRRKSGIQVVRSLDAVSRHTIPAFALGPTGIRTGQGNSRRPPRGAIDGVEGEIRRSSRRRVLRTSPPGCGEALREHRSPHEDFNEPHRAHGKTCACDLQP
jgi:hypothetical protein